jgi:hypothetical protein
MATRPAYRFVSPSTVIASPFVGGLAVIAGQPDSQLRRGTDTRSGRLLPGTGVRGRPAHCGNCAATSRPPASYRCRSRRPTITTAAAQTCDILSPGTCSEWGISAVRTRDSLGLPQSY